MMESNIQVKGKGRQPYSSISYRPELDLSPFCNEAQTQLYQNFIGMLRWAVELGRIDILLETAQMSCYMANPRIGQLHQLFHIFHYLKHHISSWIPMDPEKLDINWSGEDNESPQERRKIMKTLYRDAKEEIPMNAPTPRGRSVQTNAHIDADHAGNKVTRKSQTGILIFCNMAPVIWYSKRQNTVETSTFGSEYIALRTGTEMIIALRYKLRMMGVPLDGPTNVFCDNESVVKSSVNPETTLKKKHVSIAFHKCRDSFAAGIINVFFQRSSENLADLFTKVLPVDKRKEIFRGIFF